MGQDAGAEPVLPLPHSRLLYMAHGADGLCALGHTPALACLFGHEGQLRRRLYPHHRLRSQGSLRLHDNIHGAGHLHILAQPHRLGKDFFA